MWFSKKKAWKGLAITLAAVMTISVLSACGKKESKETKDNSKVVATYKGGEITEDEFNKQLKIMTFLSPEYAQLAGLDDFRDYLVKQKIAFKYLSEKSDDAAKKEGEKNAGLQIDQMKKMVGDEQFTKMLDQQKLKEEDLKQYFNQVMTSIADMNAKIKPEEIQKQYDATKQDYTVVTARHVLIGLQDANGKERTKEDALKIAKDVKSQLDKGADFAEIAKKYSEDPGSKDNGGLYKDTPAGQWVEEFKQAALTLPLNKVSDPVETNYGYHIIKVESRTETPFDKLTDEQKDTIKNNLAAAKIDDFMQKDLKDIVKKIDLPKAESSDKGADTQSPQNGSDKADNDGKAKDTDTKSDAGEAATDSGKTDGK